MKVVIEDCLPTKEGDAYLLCSQMSIVRRMGITTYLAVQMTLSKVLQCEDRVVGQCVVVRSA